MGEDFIHRGSDWTVWGWRSADEVRLQYREIAKEGVDSGYQPEELHDLDALLADQYVCNFSVFQSLLDHWALKQLFPIAPLHRLNEKPTVNAILVDITCDSDGKIDRFIDLKDVRETLELHDWKDGQDYYLGIFLTGAYQEVMGSHHNLFGNPNEAQVVIDNDGRYHVTKIIPGSRINDMLQFARYDQPQLLESYRKQLRTQVEAGVITKEVAEELANEFDAGAQRGTYLS